jgi:LacI family transcriptional regulator
LTFVSEDEAEILADNYEFYNGSRLARRLIGADCGADAVFACNDATAIGTMAVLAQHGIRVPQDMAVLGLDNILMGRVVTPSLSSLECSPERIGELVLAMLTEESGVPRHETITPTLIARESTARRS